MFYQYWDPEGYQKGPGREVLGLLPTIGLSTTPKQGISREMYKEKLRKNPGSQGVGRHANSLRGIFSDKKQSDGRTDTRRPYAEEHVARLGYDHTHFKPGINGALTGAATRKAPRDVLVRVPVQVAFLMCFSLSPRARLASRCTLTPGPTRTTDTFRRTPRSIAFACASTA